eukprot:RCo038520
MTRFQEACGEEGLEVGVGLVGPPQGVEGVQAGAEPCVQHVRILLQAKLGALLRFQPKLRHGDRGSLLLAAGHHPGVDVLLLVAIPWTNGGVVGRNAVPPPELAAHAPRANVLEPVIPDRVVAIRDQPELTCLHSANGAGRQLLAVHEPLRLQERLNDVVGAAAQPHAHHVGGGAAGQTHLVQLLLDCPAAVKTLHPSERRPVFVDHPILSEDAYHCKPVPLTSLKVVRVVGWSHLHRTRAKGHIDQQRIADQRDLSLAKRALQLLPVKVLISGVLRVNRNRSVPENCLRSGGCHDDFFVAPNNLVRKVEQIPKLYGLVVSRNTEVRFLLHINVLHLNVRNCRAQCAAPVHQLGCANNLPVLV